jgi:hypothetical protein
MRLVTLVTYSVLRAGFAQPYDVLLMYVLADFDRDRLAGALVIGKESVHSVTGSSRHDCSFLAN